MELQHRLEALATIPIGKVMYKRSTGLLTSQNMEIKAQRLRKI